MKTQSPADLTGHRVVSREEWIAERKAFLVKEKEFTCARDEHGAWLRYHDRYGD